MQKSDRLEKIQELKKKLEGIKNEYNWHKEKLASVKGQLIPIIKDFKKFGFNSTADVEKEIIIKEKEIDKKLIEIERNISEIYREYGQ